MELKEFITEAISAIADATNDLQEKYADKDILINPPTDHAGSDVFEAGGGHHTFRRVQTVEFDVALTVGSDTAVEGGAGIRVFSAQIGGKAEKGASSEQVSRVKFFVPITLKPTSAEDDQRAEKKARDAKLKQRKENTSRGGKNSWMGR